MNKYKSKTEHLIKFNTQIQFILKGEKVEYKEIDRIIRNCRNSEHHRIKQFGRTLTNWYDGIKGFCEYSTKIFKFTNTLTEGFNNSCKVAKRQAHGFKLKENYFRKIFVKCMLKNARNSILNSQ